jgi:hypothetical protein
VQAKKITGSPNKMLDELTKVLQPHASDTYTIAIKGMAPAATPSPRTRCSTRVTGSTRC